MLLSRWVDHGTERIKGGVRLEIFMNVDATQEQIDDVRSALERRPADVKSFRFFDKDAAFEEFKRIFRKDPDLVKNITADALPTSFRIVPERAELTDDDQRPVRDRSPASTTSPPPRRRSRACSTPRTRPGSSSSACRSSCSVSSLFLIVNTIRLATFARRREIEVMKLVGASNWFVRVPFMAEGLVQGLIGAGLARRCASGR